MLDFPKSCSKSYRTREIVSILTHVIKVLKGKILHYYELAENINSDFGASSGFPPRLFFSLSELPLSTKCVAVNTFLRSTVGETVMGVDLVSFKVTNKLDMRGGRRFSVWGELISFFAQI